MRHPIRSLAAQAAAALAVALGGGPAHAAGGGFVALSSTGDHVLKRCNPHHVAAQQRCRVTSLPGESGYRLVASRSSDVVKNDVVIGRLLDRVWKRADGAHIFGAQLQLNADAFDLTGLSFNANDLFRQVLEDKPVSVAYFQGTAQKALLKAGRTLQGLNEVPPEDDDDDDGAGEDAADEPAGEEEEAGPEEPVRDNDWVDFRIDVNAAEPEGVSSAHSPWLLVKTRAPAGFSVQPFAIRLLSSDFPDASEFIDIYLSGYQPD